MKHPIALLSLAMTLTLTLAGLAGCGGSTTITQTPPSIASFVAGSTTITAGQSTTLTAVFSNGTGVITPGNIATTSGTAISVSPTTTTAYTLTVTGSSGAPVTATVTVTVNPAPPVITSFTAAPATITVGQSSSLTAVFTGGTGVITPGNITASSGTAVSVSPTATTTYTLTVTPTSGTAVTQTVTVTVNALPPPPTISSFVAGSTTITAGQSTTLTGVFANGTGVITPGNLPATSGTAITVTPAATTTYTLTVTPASGTAVAASVTITVNPAPPSITSFTATPATITAGQTSSLKGVFAGGSGVITPGNYAVTSGTAISVTPATTTTYTLTVTPTSGTAVKQTVTVTVSTAPPPPAISSFTASPVAIASGQSSTLTGVFSGGTGVITPGNLTATSGTGVSVSPTATTTYTLTVTPTTGSAVTATATVTIGTAVSVDQSSTGPAVTDQLLGMNMAVWYDLVENQTGILNGFEAAGIKAVRWPGGSDSDLYHWQTNTLCDGQYAVGNDEFSNFVSDLAVPAGLDVALTADYGSNAACNGGGEPSEAAAWAAQAVADGLTVSHMTVGNEVYGSWEYDLHAVPNDPTTYAAAVAGASGYYKAIKAASPNTLVGVVVDADNNANGWDNIVLANAKGYYDFVEFHYYPETPGQESDSFLVNQGAPNLTNNIQTVEAELAKWGTADVPIYVGEIGGPYSNPGKQSWSITQGLYAGQVLGEMMNDGVSRLTWWIGYGNCNGQAGNDGTSVYGWQDFGAYNVFSDGASDTTCQGAGPIGTMSPTARAFELFSNVAVDGESVLTPTVTGDTTDVVAYAATHSGGTALVLFNRNETTPQTVVVTLSGQSTSSGVTLITYDKALYDQSGSPTGTPPDPNGTSTWAAPTTNKMGAQSLPLTLTLTPWSMNVVILK